MSLVGVASVSKNSFTPKEINNEEITVIITNTLEEDVEIIQYLSKLAYVKEIDLNGTKLTSIDVGICKRMRAPEDEDYTLVPKGQSIVYKIPIRSANFNSTKYFDLSKQGSYTVTLNDVIDCKISQKETDVKLTVNTVQFIVQ